MPSAQHPHLHPHPRLQGLIQRARVCSAALKQPPALGLVYPCDALALQAAQQMQQQGLARPVLVGPRGSIERAADAAGLSIAGMELLDTPAADQAAPQAAAAAIALARQGGLAALMKGSLHTDELMAAVARKTDGLWGESRMSHVFLFDLPRYHKLLALADCVITVAPSLRTKRHILGNALQLLRRLGVEAPKVAIVAALETVNTAMPATLDAQALVAASAAGAWPGAVVEGPFGFDNAFSAAAARIKGLKSQVAGDADLMLMPDLNAGNMLYKSFVYVGGGECAGLVLGTKVPLVLTSRADSAFARLASVALAVLATA